MSEVIETRRHPGDFRGPVEEFPTSYTVSLYLTTEDGTYIAWEFDGFRTWYGRVFSSRTEALEYMIVTLEGMRADQVKGAVR